MQREYRELSIFRSTKRAPILPKVARRRSLSTSPPTQPGVPARRKKNAFIENKAFEPSRQRGRLTLQWQVRRTV